MTAASLLILVLTLCVQQFVLAVDPVVDLGYAKYRGISRTEGIIRWAGMRYAKAPTRMNGLRFKAPQDPEPQDGIIDADEFGALCIGTGTDLKQEVGGNFSEDCLFANVFAPADATKDSKLPVFVFIQGGGFNINGNANYNGTKLIRAADNNIIIVNFNYRVGPYGFLASKEIQEDSTLSLNNGLKDQRQLLKWVKTHIQSFGGDPDHVTLGGASAGAGSVVLQLTAYGGRDDKLFQAAAAESPAAPPLRDVTENQFAFDALRKKMGCKNLKCMQELDAVKFQNAVRELRIPFPGAKNPPLYFYNPTLDYDFIRDYTYNELQAGHFINVPTIFGYTTNEGTIFTPKSVETVGKAETFIRDQFVNLNRADMTMIRQVWGGPPDLFYDPRWRTYAASIYGHIRYTCPSLNASAAYTTKSTSPTYSYRWNVGSALHVADLGPIWNNATQAPGVFIQSYWASFIRSFDPNKHIHDFVLPGGTRLKSPKWETFGDGVGKRMMFGDDNHAGMEEVSVDDREKCRVITGLGTQLQQ
ncbi:alpha/beta-hydrolase [Amniculicola lignicola CBS 123094]|uniref:Carboxylic ester hydrolase n=1 Tax=Amniculicola lignicola CBS 123094 TaxID=1392246 RepID=A0A6A5WJ74_9PLEO|nr:alpha/beta-hydrolase [Amniculicola lignicola CBS 123094]